MALSTAHPGPSGETTLVEAGKDLAGLIVRDSAGLARAGVFPVGTASLVSARADMYVDVAAFKAALVRSGRVALIDNDGTEVVAATAAPVSNSRMDVLYVKQNVSASPDSDANNSAVFGWQVGTPGAVPVKPTLSVAGALELATITIPSTATATNSVGVVITQTAPFAAAVGGVLPFRTTTEMNLFTPAGREQVAFCQADNAQYGWNGSAWVPRVSGSGVVRPSAATNGSVSAVGVVTSTAQSFVRVRDAFPSGSTRFRILFDINTSSAASLVCVLASGATDAVTLYDNQLRSSVNLTTATAFVGSTTAWTVSGVAIVGRHVGEILLWGPNAAAATEYLSRAWSTANPASTASGLYDVGGQHQASTAYDSITFKASAGNVTINSLTVEAIGIV